MAIISNASVRILLIAFLLLTSCSYSLTQDRITGKALSATHCAKCHHIGLSGSSPNKDAPPFWQLGEHLPVETIDETLLLQLSPEHSDMPLFKLAPKQANSIMLWIKWVQPKAHGARLVNHYCMPCHATGQHDESEHPQATPFRDVSKFTSMMTLRKKFANGIETDHPDMPNFGVDGVVLERILTHIEAQQNPK